MLTRQATARPTRPRRVGRSRRLLAVVGAAVLLLGAPAAVPAGAALRADPPANCPPDQTDCQVWDDEPGSPGGGGNPGGGNGGGGSGQAKCQWQGEVVPCYHPVLGWFNNGDGCYYKLEEPQPAGTPEGQQWYLKSCDGGLGHQEEVLLDAPPPGYGTPPDPEELARRALASITLLPPRIAVTPRKDIGPGLVGLPVWFWASRGESYFGPITATAEDRGISVRISASVDRVVWDLGNGEQVTCHGPGTRYDADGPHAGGPSPDCGYHQGYPRAGTYQVQATTYWTVPWSGGDESGVLETTRTSGVVEIQINELQVVTE